MQFQAFALAEVLAALPAPAGGGRRYVEPFSRGHVRLGLYAPWPSDPQQPHIQDEFYVVVRGNAVLVLEATRAPCAAGDALFVAAGQAHRFEELSADFAAWVVFFDAPGDTSG